MRWNGQDAEADRAARLPGLGDSAIRTFDAPEALETRFHEVHAKSALNRVPGASKLPFGWTVNTYRGCSHACSYCVSGDSLVLMADGRTRRMADLQPGDAIYGTEKRGLYRRFVRTQVLDHWSTVKPAYRVTLAGGTELVASGDHRFLSSRGWKHVTGSMAGMEQRPYLTTSSELIGMSGFKVAPSDSADYRRGYVTGLVRGDGDPAGYAYDRPGRAEKTVHRLGSPPPGGEALDRCEQYLTGSGLVARSVGFAGATGRRRVTRSPGRATIDAPRELIAWPLNPTDDWRKGFLAGLFDAKGCCAAGTGALRIATADPAVMAWTESCLRHLGFDFVVEDHGRAMGPRCVRLRGGVKQRLRFLHLTDPAITRKRDIEGLPLKSDADLRVASIEPLPGAMRLYDITTGTGDFIVNGVVSHNCFARPTHEYLDLDAGRDFEREIIVKVNAPEVLRAELRRPSWKREHVALGTNTDPYQWVERRYRLTRAVLEALRDARNPCSVLTKSPLLLRDLDLFQELMEVTEFSACLSIPTLDEKAWRATEPHTPHPRKRLEAVAELNANGIPTGVLVAPLMPGINDSSEQVREVVEACRAAGATRVGGQALFLRGSTKDVFMGFLRQQRPDLVPLYERLYGGRTWLPTKERQKVEADLRRLTRTRPAPDLASRFQRGADASPARTAAEVATGRRTAHGAVLEAEAWRPPPKQEALF